MTRQLAVGLLLVSLLVPACDQADPTDPLESEARFLGVPADGNGNKQVVQFELHSDVSCGPGLPTLHRTLSGWIQYRILNGSGVELDVFRQDMVFTDAAGEEYVWRFTGVGRYWVEGGFLVVEGAGRDAGDIGHLKINVTSGEVIFVHGIDGDLPKVRACAALT